MVDLYLLRVRPGTVPLSASLLYANQVKTDPNIQMCTTNLDSSRPHIKFGHQLHEFWKPFPIFFSNFLNMNLINILKLSLVANSNSSKSFLTTVNTRFFLEEGWINLEGIRATVDR